MNEKTSVNVIRILLTVFSVFIMSIACGMLVFRYTIANPDFWIDLITGPAFKEVLIEAFAEDMDEEIGEYVDDPREFCEDLVNMFMEEMSEVIEGGDAKIDSDAFDEFYDEYLGDLEMTPGYELYGTSRNKEEFRENLEESLEEIKDELVETGYYRMIKTVDRTLTIPACIMLGIVAVAFAALIPFHKIKIRVLRNLSISTAVTAGLSALGTGGIMALLSAVIKAAAQEEELAADFMDALVRPFYDSFTKVCLIELAVFAIGIVLIVLTGIAVRTIKLNHEDEEPEYRAPSDPYAGYSNIYE